MFTKTVSGDAAANIYSTYLAVRIRMRTEQKLGYSRVKLRSVYTQCYPKEQKIASLLDFPPKLSKLDGKIVFIGIWELLHRV